MSKRSVTVLIGGPDAERDVSIDSGTAVANALKQHGGYEVNMQLIDRPAVSDIATIKSDVVFPVLHGPFGEGGPLQEMLEQVGIPFVGSSSETAANAMNKVISKQIANSIGIPTPSWCVLAQNQPCAIPPPLVIKPIEEGSSVDIEICEDEASVSTAQSRLQQKRSGLMAETYVDGREITVGIIDGKALPIIEILPPIDLNTYSYAAKYERDDTRFIVEPDIPENNCIETAIDIYTFMGIRDIARVDYILDDDGAWFLEINTMPGFTHHSLIPMAARHMGLDMPDLCAKLVDNALARIPFTSTPNQEIGSS